MAFPVANYSTIVKNEDLSPYRVKSAHLICGQLVEVVRKEKIDSKSTLVVFKQVTA